METTVTASSLRWKILRQALLRKPTGADSQSEISVKKITRKTTQGFNLIPSHIANDPSSRSGDVTVCYTLPGDSAPKLHLTQRVVHRAELSDFEICNEYNIDNTGLVCQWPSEEVLAYFCLTHADMFRSKSVLELGSGYGLGGLVIAAVTEASEVVISDGNPQVVHCILIASLNCEHGRAWNVFKHEHVLYFYFLVLYLCYVLKEPLIVNRLPPSPFLLSTFGSTYFLISLIVII
ncbi:unnamed protein product [Malus baccata var. baccata]